MVHRNWENSGTLPARGWRDRASASRAARGLLGVAVAGRMVDHAGGAAARTGGVLALGHGLSLGRAQVGGDPPTDARRSSLRVHGDGDALVFEILNHGAQRSHTGDG